jgi:hypothetical protein
VRGLKDVEHWGVDIRINGERVLTIESNCLSAEVSLEHRMRLTMGGN